MQKRDFPAIMCEALEGKHIDMPADDEYCDGIPAVLESKRDELAELLEE